jgi:hypothetical protein
MIFLYFQTRMNRICDVIVSVLVLSAVDRVYEPLSGLTKDYKMCICCFSAKHTALRRTRMGSLETG